MKYYYTYKITCTEGSLKDKIYFGKRTTTKLNDNYKGSGKIIRDYLKKYPNGYEKEIIAYYNTPEELNKAEYELIHPHIGKDYCLNIYEGGQQGPINQHSWNLGISRTKEEKDNISKGTIEGMIRNNASEKISKKHKGRVSTFKNKHHKEESKKLIGSYQHNNYNFIHSTANTHRVYDNPEHTKWHMEKNNFLS